MHGNTKRDISRLSRELYRSIIGPRLAAPPTVLWHYTTPEGLLGILRSNQIWLTNSSYLNDAEETELARTRLRQSLVKATASEDQERLRSTLVAQLAPRESEQGYFSPAFISCFSEDEDSLVQWRGYGRGEGGFSLGFSLPMLFDMKRAHFGTTDTWLLPCSYKSKDLDRLASLVCKGLLGLRIRSSDTPEEIAIQALSDLSWAGACMKHHAFSSEKEWRLVMFDHEHLGIEFGFGDTLKPRLVYNFGGNEAFKRSLSTIMVGPQRHQALAARSVRELLKKNGFLNTAVATSTIPFRSI